MQTSHPGPRPNRHFSLLEVLWHDQAISEIWSPDASIAAWLKVESALAQAQGTAGLISRENARLISDLCDSIEIDQDLIWEQTMVVGYPILPLLDQLTNALPPAAAGQLHYGATTQDIMDSALALQLIATADRLETMLIEFGTQLAVLMEQNQFTVMAGRTHAQQAVPTTFGAKIAVFLDQVTEELLNLRRNRDSVGVVSLFGAAGTSAATAPASRAIRAAVAQRLGLANATVPWHVARADIARFGHALTTISTICVRFAREIIDLSRTEVGEVHERGGHHRGASSTMPQKANPISCEAVIGFGISASSVASGLIRAIESGHERATGEWQIEWFALPTLAQLAASAVGLSADIARGLHVATEKMAANLDLDHGLVMSEAAMMYLAPILGRDKAHELIYEAASRSRTEGISLFDSVQAGLPVDAPEGLTGLSARNYLGEVLEICGAALARWESVLSTLSTDSREPERIDA